MKCKRILIVLCLFTLIITCSAVGQEGPDLLAIRGAFADALDSHDLDAIVSYFSEDGVQEVVVLPVPLLDSKEKIWGFYADQFSGSPDWHTSEGRVLTDGNIVVVDHAALGTNTGPSAGLPITGNPWTFPHLDIYEFEGDKINRLTTYADYASVLVQLGLAPMPEMPSLVPSVSVPDPEATGLSPMEANAELISRWNSHDPALLAKMIHGDSQIFAGPLGAYLDRIAMVAMNELYFMAFPEARLEVVRTVDLGDGWILTELLSQGPHLGPFMGVPASGYLLDIRMAWLTHYDADGLATEQSYYFDNMTLMDQMTTASYPLDGIWITSSPTPLGNWISTTTYVAQDAAKTRYSGTLEFINGFPLFAELYPDADPSLVFSAGGQAVMVGRNKYEATYLTYDRKFDPSTGIMEIVGIDTLSASFEVVGPDQIKGSGMASYYMAAQDADQDGSPVEGQEPVACFPWEWTSKRLTAMPGCTQ
jgi:predicted ester cyclase